MSVARGGPGGAHVDGHVSRPAGAAPARARVAAEAWRGAGFACGAPFGVRSTAFEPAECRGSSGGGGASSGRRRGQRRFAPVRHGDGARRGLRAGFWRRSNKWSTASRTARLDRPNDDDEGRAVRCSGGRSTGATATSYGELGDGRRSRGEGGVAHVGCSRKRGLDGGLVQANPTASTAGIRGRGRGENGVGKLPGEW
jgi:hypothetical protein